MRVISVTLTLICMVLALASCTKCEDVIDTSVQVGSVVCSDGTIVNPLLYDDDKMQAVAVVFYVNTQNEEGRERGYAVALEDIAECSMLENLVEISEVSESLTDYDGMQNTVGFLNYANDEEISAEAASASTAYSPFGYRGWYVPSVSEMRELNNSISRVESVITSLGGDSFLGWYWTSTEDGTGEDTAKRFVHISQIANQRFTVAEKTTINKVRPIIPIR